MEKTLVVNIELYCNEEDIKELKATAKECIGDCLNRMSQFVGFSEHMEITEVED